MSGRRRGEDWECAPRHREAEVGVHEPTEEFQVIGQDEERANDHEAEQSESDPCNPDRTQNDRTAEPECRRAAQQPRRQRRVASGRPRNSSRAWAATPTARKNAMSVAMSVVQLTCGAIIAPSTTYERCQAVYGGWSTARTSRHALR